MPRKPQESFGKLSHGKPASKMIRICPMCKKPTLRPADSISGWMTAPILSCSNCGYRGIVYLEVDADEFEKFQSEESRESRNKESSKE
nr:hypothetical protein [Candidatus Njordarchaeota archaeon]